MCERGRFYDVPRSIEVDKRGGSHHSKFAVAHPLAFGVGVGSEAAVSVSVSLSLSLPLGVPFRGPINSNLWRRTLRRFRFVPSSAFHESNLSDPSIMIPVPFLKYSCISSACRPPRPRSRQSRQFHGVRQSPRSDQRSLTASPKFDTAVPSLIKRVSGLRG